MFCETCAKRKDCKETCPELEDYLKSQGIYSADYIRPQVSRERQAKDHKGRWREIPFSSLSDKNPQKNPLLGGSNE